MSERTPAVFVVDDDAAVRKAVSRLLHSAEIAVAVFASPSDFSPSPSGTKCCSRRCAPPSRKIAHAQQRVTKGGSFLCAENYCLNYRPSARRGTDYDTGMSHLGFRRVRSPDQRDQINPDKLTKANP